jgi:hypothetical protein
VRYRLHLFISCVIFLGAPAVARDKAALPDRADVIAAVNRAGEDRLVAYLNQYPVGSVTGHVIPARKLLQLLCVSDRNAASVDCHFAAHYHDKIVYHIATLTRDGDVWRIVDDHMIDIPRP